MRTTKEISDSLKETEEEIKRISVLISSNDKERTEPLLYKNNKRSEVPEVTNDWYLINLISKRATLKWVLNSNK